VQTKPSNQIFSPQISRRQAQNPQDDDYNTWQRYETQSTDPTLRVRLRETVHAGFLTLLQGFNNPNKANAWRNVSVSTIVTALRTVTNLSSPDPSDEYGEPKLAIEAAHQRLTSHETVWLDAMLGFAQGALAARESNALSVLDLESLIGETLACACTITTHAMKTAPDLRVDALASWVLPLFADCARIASLEMVALRYIALLAAHAGHDPLQALGLYELALAHNVFASICELAVVSKSEQVFPTALSALLALVYNPTGQLFCFPFSGEMAASGQRHYDRVSTPSSSFDLFPRLRRALRDALVSSGAITRIVQVVTSSKQIYLQPCLQILWLSGEVAESVKADGPEEKVSASSVVMARTLAADSLLRALSKIVGQTISIANDGGLIVGHGLLVLALGLRALAGSGGRLPEGIDASALRNQALAFVGHPNELLSFCATTLLKELWLKMIFGFFIF
jgi:hypothetical protein